METNQWTADETGGYTLRWRLVELFYSHTPSNTRDNTRGAIYLRARTRTSSSTMVYYVQQPHILMHSHTRTYAHT